jgi:opacity protein-like surface antigen
MPIFRYVTAFLALLLTSTAAAGSGQYWRLGVIWEYSQSATFLDRECEPAGDQVAFFGCIDGVDGRPIGARGDFGGSVGTQLGWGMHFGEMWRTELSFAHQSDFLFDGNANFLDSGENQPVVGSVRHSRAGVNLYLDLAAAFARNAGIFEPYVGGGLNIVRNRTSTMAYIFPALQNQPAMTTVPGDSRTDVGWTMVAGTGIELTPRNVIDLGVSWHDHGKVQTADDFIDIVRGGDTVASVEVGSTSARLQSWGISLSWRRYIH